MQEYVCTVKQSNGSLLKKYSVKAEDDTALVATLKSNQLYLVDYRLKETRKDIYGGNKISLTTKDVALMCRQLASMLTAGVTLIKALNILYLQVEKKNIKASIKFLYESVQKGDQFSEALQKQTNVYPELMISMVEAGEASGQLDHVVGKLADQFERDLKLKSKVKAAMMYPIILAVLCIAVVLILVTFVLPVFMGMFATIGGELPAPTRILLAFSNVLTNFWYLVVIGVGILFFAFRTYISTENGRRKWDDLKLRMPLVGNTIYKIAAVRFTRTLSTLLSSGMTLLSSLEIVNKVVGNRIMMDGLLMAQEDIRRGMALSQALRKTNVLPPMVYSMVGIGEEAGTMEKMLEKCAEYYDDEVENAIQRLVSVIEPALIVLMAAIVGFIIISIMLPIFTIYEQIGG